uniref:Calcineurin-like phosphoesterase domain-containing protein n=1 Tax=Ciona savignyi TaxID=51511 RepID=H2YVN7_CIOSA
MFVVGNHDVGFHNDVTENKLQRFFKEFSSKNVKAISVKGRMFVAINSMGLAGDGCTMCEDTKRELLQVKEYMDCRGIDKPEYCGSSVSRPQPILLTHFPLFRESDEKCLEFDAKDISHKYVEQETLTESASSELIKLLHPRLVLSGHTHNTCVYRHGDGTTEITVASFSWRNRIDPSFYLLTVSDETYEAVKCNLPLESTVFIIYALAACFGVVFIILNTLVRHIMWKGIKYRRKEL